MSVRVEPPRLPRGDQADDSLEARYERLADTALAPHRVDIALRALDIAISGFALTAMSPVIAGIAGALRAKCGSPVLYRGERVGRAGRIFTMYKFRTLTPDAELRLGPYLGEELTRRTEGEVTDIGRLLRTSHLDELPQLYNVLRGDMSIVGPRPIRPAFFAELCEQIPQYWQRLVVRPGLTGFAQLRMTREMTWAEKLAHDLEYLADRSVGLYFRVMLATIVRVGGRSVSGVIALHKGR